MPASDIASSTTIIEAASPSAPGFGVPIIAVELTAPQDALWGVDLIRETTQSTWVADLTALGFVDGDPLYEELQTGFSQDVVPPLVLIGKRATAVAQVTNFDLGAPGAALDGDYTITIESSGVNSPETFTYASVAQTRAAIITALIGLIDAGAQPVDASVGGGAEDLDVTALEAGVSFSFSAAAPVGETWTVLTTTPNVGLSTDISAWEAERSDWYFVTELSRSVGVNASMVGPVASFSRAILFVSAVSAATDPDALDGASSTRAGALITLSQRTAVAYVPSGTDHSLAAAYFRLLPEDPGSLTWANWQLRITGTKYSGPNTRALRGMGTNPGNYWYFEAIPTLATSGITRWMRMGDQTPMDLVRGRDWVDAEIETDVGQTLIAEPKIAYTDTGSEQVIGVIAGSLSKAVRVGLIVDGSFAVTTTPRSAQVPADIAARQWRGYTWTATLAGAQEGVDIGGTLFIV